MIIINGNHKLIKFVAWLFSSLILTHCGDSSGNEPNFPIEPFIEFKSISFSPTPEPDYADTIKLVIYYRDGDDDLGLTSQVPHISNPYHSRFFYFESDGSNLSEIPTIGIYYNSLFGSKLIEALDLKSAPSGKLVTNNTPNNPGYDHLPAFNPSQIECLNYTVKEFGVPEEYEGILEDDYLYIAKVTDTELNKTFIIARDTLYFTRNEDYYNILIYFESSDDGTNWQEFSWENEFCMTFSGRFPVLDGAIGKIISGPFKFKKINRWEGTIEYNIPSTGFKILFAGKKLRLKAKIKDRAFHNSNTILTDILEF